MEENNNIKHPLKIYWEAYGGWNSIFHSYYFGAALIITFLSINYWLNVPAWIETPLSGLPSLLGFSLAGYAVWLSIGDEKLKVMLSQINGETNHSDFIVVNATFIHFIILQILSYIYLLTLKAQPFTVVIDHYNLNNHSCLIILGIIFNFLGYLIFTYSITSMLAAVLAIFQIANWTDIINKTKK